MMLALLAALHGALPASSSAAAVPSPFDDQALAALARQHSWECAPIEPAEAGPDGWRADGARCAWKGLLVMRRWTASAEPQAGACIGAAARWWAWEQQRIERTPAAPASAWQNGWKAQSLSGKHGEQYRMAFIERGPGQRWTATELAWSPSPRAATRAWQAARWQELAAAGAQRQSPLPAGLPDIGERNLRGRPGEAGENGLTWQAGATCLRLLARVPGEANFPLAYAREDARLEQRAAMQVQLTRRYPDATWLTFFSLLDLPASAGGASYEAIWAQRKSVTGQLWLPAKRRGPARRWRIVAALPANYDTQAGMAASMPVKAAIDQELRAIAQMAASAP